MSTDTLASHPVCDEVARLAAHLPCLERAAADPSAPDEVRRAVRAQIRMTRMALDLLGADLRTTPDGSERNRTNLNGPERDGTNQNGDQS